MEKNNLRDTLNLPETSFPMRANLPQNEPKWVEKWTQEDLYKKLRSKADGRPKFNLHCGPPYANGNMHMGHMLSKGLKDIVNRSKQMLGFDAVFVPGWDCHGLPIEWKIEQEINAKGKTKDDYSRADIRSMCRGFAQKWVDAQKVDWKRLGAIGDFDHAYLTMNYKNEAGIIRELGKMAEAGLLYKSAKSIMWSIVEETSLAEAEVEYADKESTAVYVKFAVAGKDEAVVIWTTTPWTLPSNKAVAYAADATYVKVKALEVFEKATAQVGDEIWLAKELLEDVAKMVGFTKYEVVAEQKGKAFEGMRLQHCFYDVQVPMLAGHHVTMDAGTGFVHIAPSHGADDFIMGQKEGLDLVCHVNGDGTYDEHIHPLPSTKSKLEGVNIWDAQKLIIDEMTTNRNLMRWHKLKHSYPVSWRSKAPLIFRTTPQWYLGLDKQATGNNNLNGKTVRQTAMDEIKSIASNNGWVPAYGENRITSMMENRGDWCLSRQRIWGVPMTIFRHKKTGEYVFDQKVFEHISSKVEELGIDAWESLSTEQLLPEGYLQAKGWQAEELEKETDILDVWFDSGTTYAHVVEEQMGEPIPADLYLEGSDQHRGWFNSSLTACCATRGHAPYKAVLTHGFVVDGDGKKMSKSLGNGIEPTELQKKYGMDIVRLWVAAADYNEDIRISEEILKGSTDSYRKFRNTFRFLLGNLSDFDENTHTVPYDKLPELEQWILSLFSQLMNQAREDYDTYRFNKVYQALHNFCTKELSNLYFDVRKDSLYCDATEGETAHRRRSCQTVLMVLLKGLTTYMAPIMPFTCDEVWRSRFGEENSVHLEDFIQPEEGWMNSALEAKWDEVMDIRRRVNLVIEELRESGKVGSSLEAALHLKLTQKQLDAMKNIDAAELFIVSAATVELADGEPAYVAQKAEGKKCQRCWMYFTELDEAETCIRCAEAVSQKSAKIAA